MENQMPINSPQVKVTDPVDLAAIDAVTAKVAVGPAPRADRSANDPAPAADSRADRIKCIDALALAMLDSAGGV
jgi:hypothetical protein